MADIQIKEALWTRPDLMVTFEEGHSPFGEWTIAKWYGGGNWDVLMGSSWEDHYSYSSEEDDLLCETAERACLIAGDKPVTFTGDEVLYLRILLRGMQKKAQDAGETLSPTWASILNKVSNKP